MTKTSKLSIGLYFLACAVEMCFCFCCPENRLWSKPILMPLLFVVALSLNQFKTQNISLLLVSIIFAWLGDIILLSDYKLSFLLGLSAFLSMHLIYIYLFNKQRSIGLHKHKLSVLIISAISTFSIVFFWNKTASLQIPVSIYCIVIGLMSLLALMRWKSQYYWHVVAGSFLFMISDILLAFNKFVNEFSSADILVMSTYLIGQFLIIYGYIKDLKN